MREIKFHGKRLDNGEWVVGYYWIEETRNHNKHHIYTFEKKGSTDLIRITGNFEVDPDTVGQYTGLPDKNGKEIYEGDIVTFNWGETTIKMIIVYQTGEFLANPVNRKEAWPIRISGNNKYFGILGNIHDNPNCWKRRRGDKMLSLELAKKLKEAGLVWEPKVGDEVYLWNVPQLVAYVDLLGKPIHVTLSSWQDPKPIEDCIFAPRLGQLLTEIEKLGWEWELGILTLNGSRTYMIDVALEDKFENEEWKSFVTDSPEAAAARALVWILEQEREGRA